MSELVCKSANNNNSEQIIHLVMDKLTIQPQFESKQMLFHQKQINLNLKYNSNTFISIFIVTNQIGELNNVLCFVLWKYFSNEDTLGINSYLNDFVFLCKTSQLMAVSR